MELLLLTELLEFMIELELLLTELVELTLELLLTELLELLLDVVLPPLSLLPQPLISTAAATVETSAG